MRGYFLKTMMMIVVMLVLSTLSARAQAGSNFTVAVPFDFIVSGKTLPAGDYIVARTTQGSEGLMIRATDGKGGVYLLTKPIQTGNSQGGSSVVFNRYGDRYFLSQVWISGNRRGRELFKSRKERSLERELTQRAIKPQTVAVVGSTK